MLYKGLYLLLLDNKDILKWGEMQDIGLATGHKVIEIKEHGVIIKYENKFIPNENIWKVLKNRKEYLKWLIVNIMEKNLVD